jgi:ribosomal protein S17E
MLDSLSTITSKALRNRVAGYITRLLKNESIELEKVENMKKQEQVEDQNEPEDLVTESVSEEAPLTETS